VSARAIRPRPPRALLSAAVVALATLLLAAFAAPRADASFGLLPGAEGFNVSAVEANGSAAEVAGSHPFALTTEINFKTETGGSFSDGDVEELRIDRPPGLIENTSVVTQCPVALFHTPRDSPFQESLSGESCPLQSQIGTITVRGDFPGGTRTFGLFNLTPPPGFSSLIGANPFGVPLTFASRIRSAEGEFGLTLVARGISQLVDLSGLTMTQWGNPWLNKHDLQRGDCLNEADPSKGFDKEAVLDPEPPPQKSVYQAGACSIGNPSAFLPQAYLTLPTSCAPASSVLTATAWEQPTPVSASSPSLLKGCEPRFLSTEATAQPTNDRASSASGLDFDLDVNQENLTKNFTPQGRLITKVVAASQIKKAVVTLPAGMSLNPSVAAGLGVCSTAQYEAETVSSTPGAGCPSSSKIGSVSVQSPLTDDPIEGSLYLAEPYRNPFGTLISLYLVARAPERDVIVKLAGKVDPDLASGQLVATFDQLPQLPYSHLNVHFRESQRAPLATPQSCGSYATQTELAPWLDPSVVASQSGSFKVTSGIDGGGCPTAAAPFKPRANGGTLNRNAGSYSPFYLHLTRSDGDQEITSYSAQLPPGLLGKIAGVPFCPESAIAAAARDDGFAQTEHPSCPAASLIGHTTAGYGLGTSLAYAPGNLYLAGPYHGSPLSVVAVDSATVGPFDLGVIIVRSAIRIDPQTARVSLDAAGSDPIPHIVKGIPLHLRDIRVFIDRPNFMVNPTSCDPFALTSTLTGSGAAFSNPADDSSAAASTPYQVSFCSSLAFKPKVTLRVKGGTRRGVFPSLTTTVTPKSGQANIGKTTVRLPPALFLEQSHIDGICPLAKAAAGQCPSDSIYGRARAVTPLMDEPLEGPVYLRPSGEKLPSLVASLSGRGVRIDVVGRIDAHHGGMRAIYNVLPDAPLTSFALTLNGGTRHGLLVASDDLCSAAPAHIRMVGQNNTGIVLRSRIVSSSCRKK
jgi:hypothetical protein